MTKIILLCLFAPFAAAALASCRGGAPPEIAPDYPIRPLPFTAVHLADDFWAPRLEINRTVTIPFIFRKCEETGRVDNFAIAGGLMQGTYKGQRYNDTDVYKTIEGAAYALAVRPDPELDAYLDGLIAKIAAAQEPDGYLFTARTASPAEPQPGIGVERWAELAVSHELYNAGHLYEAAVAHHAATGKRALLDVALKNADLVASVFGPGRREGYPGHQVIEMGLVKLYRVTGDGKYLDLAKYFLDTRGPRLPLTQYPPGNRFAIYNDPIQIQAHLPVLEQTAAVGHAVRAAYMYAGMADVAALTGVAEYLAAIDGLWANVVGRRMYLTGGIGSRHDRERFGEDYELPNATAYNETCAAIGNAFWNHRMFLLHGDAKYLDVMERIVYNGAIAGVSLTGDAFFYPNPLESDGVQRFNKGQWGRAPWFDVACCPGNISRFIPSIPGYVYAAGEGAVYVNMFAAGAADVELDGRRIRLVQETRYPWDGAIRIRLEPEAAGEFALLVRIPGWARGEAVPGDLYRFAEGGVAGGADRGAGGAGWSLRVNGEPTAPAVERGFARIERRWRSGDVVELDLPMPVRRIAAHEAVADDAGKVALQRGPLVYCLEGIDNGGQALDVVLPDDAPLAAEFRSDLLNGVVVVTAEALAGPAPLVGTAWREEARPRRGRGAAQDDIDAAPEAPRRTFPSGALRPLRLVAIPYYAWAHRGPNEMAVWIWRQ